MDRIGPAGGSPTALLSNLQQGFQDENLSTGTEGTLVPAAFMSCLQEELMTIQAVTGQAPDIANFGQLLASIKLLIQPRMYVYLPALGGFQFVPPAGMFFGLLMVIGAGGGGGPGNGYAGFGGAAGGIAIGTFNCTPGTAMGGFVGFGGGSGSGGQSSSFAGATATGGGAGTGGTAAGPNASSFPSGGLGFGAVLCPVGGLPAAPIQTGGYMLGSDGAQGIFGGGGPGGLDGGVTGGPAFGAGSGGGGGTGFNPGGVGGGGTIVILG